MEKETFEDLKKAELYLKINKRDIALGINSLLERNKEGMKINQKFLSAISGVTEAQISKLKNGNSSETVNFSTLSKLFALGFDMTFVEFSEYIKEITFKQ